MSEPLKYKTKQKRLYALIDTYLAKFKKTQFTTEEVSEWAIRTKLYPVPRYGDPLELCEAWEKLLALEAGGPVS